MATAPKPKHQRPVSRGLSPRSITSRVTQRVNFPLLIVSILLVGFGLLIVYSAILGDSDYSFSRQLMGVGIGVVLMILIWIFDYRKLSEMAVPLMIVTIVLILLPFVPGLGVRSHGATNWISIFGQQIQPSEFAKPFLILFVASLVSKYKGDLSSGKEYFKVLGMFLIPVALLVASDFGSGFVCFVTGMVILFAGGVNRKWLIITIVIIVVCVIALVALDGVLGDAFGRDVLIKDYQKDRILVFINPNAASAEARHNLEQAKIAIGSGGLTGKGFGNATQSDLGFLPEAATDFIFCVLAEQFGFVGCMGLLALYVLLLVIALRIAFSTSNSFGTLIVAGIVGMWVYHIFHNIGMCMGVMPIMGIPLPFLSFGSSFLIVNFIMLGLLCSVWAHREKR